MLIQLVGKVWLETRSRFFWGVCLVLTAVGYIVLISPRAIPFIEAEAQKHVSFPLYLVADLYNATLLVVWTLLAVLLALGGLRQEFASGRSAFSLSLPVGRRTWLLAQTLVSFCELIVLGFLPAFVIPILAHLVGQEFSPMQSAEHALVLVVPGLVFAALTVFLSHTVGSELPTVAGAFCAIGAFLVAVKKIHAFDAFDLFDTMSGVDLIDRRTFLLHGSLPWETFAITTFILLSFIGLSIWAIERLDF